MTSTHIRGCAVHSFRSSSQNDPPDFYPAYRRVKAGKNGWGLAYTRLYAPIRGVKIRWTMVKKYKVSKVALIKVHYFRDQTMICLGFITNTLLSTKKKKKDEFFCFSCALCGCQPLKFYFLFFLVSFLPSRCICNVIHRHYHSLERFFGSAVCVVFIHRCSFIVLFAFLMSLCTWCERHIPIFFFFFFFVLLVCRMSVVTLAGHHFFCETKRDFFFVSFPWFPIFSFSR